MYSIFSTYLSDPEIAELCSDSAYLGYMAKVESALAQVQAGLGIIPKEAGEEISSKLPYLEWNMSDLMEDTAKNGIPVIGFLAQARKALEPSHADYLHWGVTSQDITDTAMVLILKEVLQKVELRTREIIGHLERLQSEHGNTPMLARTRNQSAVPITFGQKLESWRAPLKRYLTRLDELRPRLFKIQLAGAGGNLTSHGNKAETTVRMLSRTLGLTYSEGWHNQRDTFVEATDFFGNLAGSFGKMGEDLLVLTQSEVAEIKESVEQGGGSSSMPHKNNPVKSEALVALSEYAMGLSGMFKRSLLHRNERDGIGLSLEWMILPQLMTTVGASLNHALTISGNMTLDKEQIKINLERGHGLIFSEKATYLLMEFMSRSEARKCISDACDMVISQGITLSKALKQTCPNVPIDWDKQFSI